VGFFPLKKLFFLKKLKHIWQNLNQKFMTHTQILLLKKVVAFVFASFLITSCNSEGTQTTMLSNSSTSCAMDFSLEDSIDLGPHVLDTTLAEAEVIEFNDVVSTSSEPNLPLLIDSIRSQAFCQLWDSAVSLQKRNSNCPNYITALKLIYGLNSANNKIVLLYQPLYLCKTAVISGKKIYSVNGASNIYYAYDHSASSFVITNDTSSIGNYADSVLISRIPGEIPSHFINPPADNDTLGDVNSVIFTFQEIDALLNDNNSTFLKLWNAAQNVYVASVNLTLRKHSVIIGPSQFTIPLAPYISPCNSGLFCNAFANLANMCPPSCNEISFY